MKSIVALLLSVPLLCFAQQFNFVFEPDSIPVTIDGWQPFCPWAGGMSRSNPDIEDLDADGDLDFFIGSTLSFKYFMNSGNQSNPDFIYLPEITNNLETEGNNSTKLCDIDNDGDLDLFATSDERVWYFENIGTPENPQFELITDSLEQIIYWASNLDLVDIDADGDFDMFTGRGNGTIVFYRNEGTPDSFYFSFEEYPFMNINVNDMSDPCFVDIDGDNDYDLFIGNGSPGGRIWYYRNDGDSVNYDFTFVTDYFEGIDVGDDACPEFADIDGDGDFDLFMGREASYISPHGDIFFYENVGSSTNPQFNFITKNYLTVDLSHETAKTQIIDINGDGRLDIIVGTARTLHYFENIGSSTDPAYNFVDQQFQGIYINGLKPAFVDIDADGDYDMFAGEAAIPGPPSIALYLNQGTPRDPQLILENPNFITNPDFFVNANPGVADIDADGDYDLFISDDDGHFFFYRNDGSPSFPSYTLVDSQWQGIQFSYPSCGWRGFNFADLDEDDDFDLLMMNLYWETIDANLRFYRNIGTPEVANMYMETNTFLPGYSIWRAYPYAIDIDSDDDLDLFVGDGNGGIMFFRNHGSSLVSPHNQIQPYTFSLHQNYPNPFNASTTIPFTLDRRLPVKVVVYNSIGQAVAILIDKQLSTGSYTTIWDADGLASGVYLVALESGGSIGQARKVMLVK